MGEMNYFEGMAVWGYTHSMEKIKALVDAWDNAHWEFTLVFEGLSDDDLWRRPHPKILSVGELAGHIAYNESYFAAGGMVDSPLADKKFSYYYDHVDAPVKLELGVEQVLEEVKKVHEAAKAGIAAVENFDEIVPWRNDFSWYQRLEYLVFHVAYHCGQAYSVRHLMGHNTTDN